MTKVSVIIPLYNKTLYVTKALDSVLAQTFTDYECIIINDGSTDDSASVVQQWIQNKACSDRFRLINQQNAGVSEARNHGIDFSRGEYTAFLDADDWWSPTYLEKMISFAAEYPDAGVWASNYVYYKPGKTKNGVGAVYDCEEQVHHEEGWKGYINYPLSYHENVGQVVWTGATLTKRSVLHDVCLEKGEYFQKGICLGEDFLLWARIALRYRVAFINQPMAYYNNDVLPQWRLTRHLHDPKTHMLWNMDSIEISASNTEQREDWRHLFDRLRINGLLEYWMSDTYHNLAAIELKKVSSPLPKVYSQPICYLRAKKEIMIIGSWFKQKLVRLIYK